MTVCLFLSNTGSVPVFTLRITSGLNQLKPRSKFVPADVFDLVSDFSLYWTTAWMSVGDSWTSSPLTVGSSLVSLVVWGSSDVPLVVKVSVFMSSLFMVSLATASAAWDSSEVPLSSEGGEAAVVVRVPPPSSSAAVALSVVLLSAEIWLVGWLSELDAWLFPERWLVAWPSVRKALLLLLLFVWSGGCVVTEESVAVVLVPGREFTVHESWLNSGSWWTTAGIGVTWFKLMGSLATWLLVDGWLIALLTADCQLLEQRTAGALWRETKSEISF